MKILVLIELVVLVLISFLVVGLLRSHAETLRNLSILQKGGSGADLPRRESDAPLSHDLVGESPSGGAIQIPVASSQSPMLLAFLSTGCLTCGTFWESLSNRDEAALPGAVSIVIVTKDRSNESPSRLLELAPASIPVVMSSAAWSDYEVAGSPYFVYVDALGSIAGEGTAQGWNQVKSLFRDFLLDLEVAERYDFSRIGLPLVPARSASSDDTDRDDNILTKAGVHPDHPSLYAPMFDSSAGGDSTIEVAEGHRTS